MINIKTYIRSDYKDLEATRPIYLRLWLQSVRIVLPTEIKVDPKYWNEEKQVVRKSCKDAKDLNAMIRLSHSRLNEIFIKYRLSKIDLTPDLLKVEFNESVNNLDFIAWAEKDIKNRRGLLTDITIKNQLSIIRSIQSFKSVIPFSSINKPLIENYEKHLKLKEKNTRTTIEKKLKTFKAYLNRAIEANMIKENPFSRILIKKGKFLFQYLEHFELIKLIEYYKDPYIPENEKKALRLFLFSCMTGLRLSDVKRLSKENIVNSTIVIRPKKTSNSSDEIVKIPLTPLAKFLIAEESKHRLKGPIFNTYADATTNEYLKRSSKHLKFEKSMKFNMSRHTFATLFLEKTKDLAALQKLLGHSNIKQTMVYAHVSEAAKQKGMNEFATLFELN